ncbi:MAG: glycosyltransferase family 2 protein [Bacteroidales bacterium]
MISVCIPVYNSEVSGLVDSLIRQGLAAGIPFEIIAIDDYSDTGFRKCNQKELAGFRYIALERNIGRAKIRNLFLEYAKYDKLLFLDCDSVIISEEFLQKYINKINQDFSKVICGGTVYEAKAPPLKKRLRWKYGINREVSPPSVRNKHPYRHFRSNNFLIDREVFKKLKFDERIAGYGHEDTLFAYDLQKNNISLLHTDNPVKHHVHESNREFIAKTRNSISNLIQITGYAGKDVDFIRNIRILRVYKKIKDYSLRGITGFVFVVCGPVIEFVLVRGGAWLWLYDFYKLGHLIRKDKICNAGKQSRKLS